jgi:hypothetical protein
MILKTKGLDTGRSSTRICARRCSPRKSGPTRCWPIGRTTPDQLRGFTFGAGTMGPKVEAAFRFAERTGRIAVIGAIDQAVANLVGKARTVVHGIFIDVCLCASSLFRQKPISASSSLQS